METEKTLVLIKPDSVMRSLTGKIISRFEEAGLKIIGMKMVKADKKMAEKHYPLDVEWAKKVFEKTKSAREKEGRQFEYKDPIEFGSLIQSWNINFLQESPVIAMALEGPHAIEVVRKIIGPTEPKQAPPGTIRGDYAMFESYEIANKKSRVLRNLVHASDSKEAAERELSLWFKSSELHNYAKELDKHL